MAGNIGDQSSIARAFTQGFESVRPSSSQKAGSPTDVAATTGSKGAKSTKSQDVSNFLKTKAFEAGKLLGKLCNKLAPAAFAKLSAANPQASNYLIVADLAKLVDDKKVTLKDAKEIINTYCNLQNKVEGNEMTELAATQTLENKLTEYKGADLLKNTDTYFETPDMLPLPPKPPPKT